MSIYISYWSSLAKWVPGGKAAQESTFPLVPIGELLKPRTESVPAVDFQKFKPITIHFDGSMDARDRAEPFKGSMFAAYAGDVVFSKIDLRNGAIAIVPPSLEKVVVTAEYPVHVPDKDQTDPRYLALLLRSANFLYLLKRAATGTSGRKRISPDTFGEFEVPLPDLAQQTALADAYTAEMQRASDLDNEATDLEGKAIAAFEGALGLEPPEDLPRKPVQIVRFKEVDRWSHEGNLDRQLLAANGDGKQLFPLVSLGDVIADLRNGWSPQCLDRKAAADEWGVLKVGAVSVGTFDESQNKALPHGLKPKPDLEVKAGDVLISRDNVLRLVGACALVTETRHRLMLCDKIFRVVFLKNSPVDPEFLVEVLKLQSLRQQIEAAATGTSPTMKNISKPSLLDLTFPCPMEGDGVAVQKALVASLRAARRAAVVKRTEAQEVRTAARADFSNALFQ